MSKRPFDHIENKIREAAENSEPLFNEQAWAKMELLLDKEKKRRFFIWWRFGLPLLLAGMAAGGWMIYQTTYLKKVTGTKTAAAKEMPKQKSKVPVTPIKPAVDTTVLLNEINPKLTVSPAEVSKQNNISNIVQPKTALLSSPSKNTFAGGVKSSKQPDFSLSSSVVKDHTSKKKYRGTKARATVSINADYANATDAIEQPGVTNPANTTGINQQPDDEAFDNLPKASSHYKSLYNNATLDTVSHEEEKIATESLVDNKVTDSVTKKAVKKKKTGGRFYVLIGGGAEINKTKFLSYSNSDVSARFGAGIGYNISKRFSVQTGFYAGRKKYIGGPNDYHPKQGSYWNMVNMKTIDASCLVFDIPVSFRYNFSGAKAPVKWYAMAGVSSFIMKKEDYHYHYTYPNMPNVVHDKAYSYSGNKNLFSIFTLSAGFERKISNRTAILAEPYFSLPLAGVGDGAVKLYSTGLQLGIKYHPKF